MNKIQNAIRYGASELSENTGLRAWEVRRRHARSDKFMLLDLSNSVTNRLSKEEDVQEYAEVRGRHPLAGRSIAIKDNICTATLPTSCGSKMLREFKSPYEATVVELIRQSGGVIPQKTNLDEFGMGSHSMNSFFGPVIGKKNREGIFASAGGSSGGSAVAVRNRRCHASLGTDTGGSVRLPAAYNDVVGFKPSYGLISRWGVVAYANSMDTVGIISSKVERVKAIFDLLNVHDEKDPTSLSQAGRHRLGALAEVRSDGLKTLRIGIPAEYNIWELSQDIGDVWARTIESLQSLNHSIRTISLPSTKQALSAYYILAPAEASSNLAKYDGVRYGGQSDENRQPSSDGNTVGVQSTEIGENSAPPQVLFSKTRRAGFGQEVRRRILLGAYSLSAMAIDNYFIQAQRIRRLVQEDFDRVFAFPNVASNSKPANDENRVDAILCPTAPTVPPTLKQLETESSLESYTNDVFTVPASLAGLPAISVPVNKWFNPGRPRDAIGMQIITQYGDDYLALALADQLERSLALKFSGMIANPQTLESWPMSNFK